MPIQTITADDGTTYVLHSEIRTVGWGAVLTRKRAEAELLMGHADLSLKAFRLTREVDVLFDSYLSEECPDVEALITLRLGELRDMLYKLACESPLVLLADGDDTRRATVDGKKVDMSPESIAQFCGDMYRAALEEEGPLRAETHRRKQPPVTPDEIDQAAEVLEGVAKVAKRARKRARVLRSKVTPKATRKVVLRSATANRTVRKAVSK